nr:DEP domain-containing protein DDB_G0279099-like [Penaeus vannamei]
MRDQDQRQGESKGARLPPGFSIGSQDHVVGHNGFKPNSGFTVGSQDHIIGSNPFGDTLSNINIQSQSDVGFGNIQQTGGEKFNNNYNFNSGGGSNFNNGGGNNFGGGGNGVRVSGGGGIPGFNSGSNSGGNYINNGGNNLNSGGNFNNGGNNFNNGDHNFNNGGGNFNNGGNSFNGGSGMSVIPPVHNTHDRGTSKSRPFNIMLDVYPMDDRPVPSGSRPFQTSISFNGGNGRFDSDSSGGRFSGGSSNNYHNGINENNYNSGNSYNGNGFNNNNGNRYNDNDRFSNRDDANKHEVILHLNLFSKSPLSIRRQGTVDDFASGRSGAVSVELPLTGQLSPLDVYKAIISKARTSTAQAQVQLPPGADTDSRDEVEIELFDVEEGPRLLQAIEFGLQELNPSLPPDLRFVFDRSPASASDLHEAVNGEDTGPSWNSSASSPNNDEMWPSLSWPAAEYDHNDDYTYYDYYEYEDYVADAVDTETTTLTTRTTTTTETTTSGSQTEKAELLPTPCWHSAEDGKSASGAS